MGESSKLKSHDWKVQVKYLIVNSNNIYNIVFIVLEDNITS